MKFSTEELLFAVAVRNLVRSKMQSQSMNIPDEELESFLARPANDLIKETLEELDGIASVIAAHRGKT